MTAGRRGLGRAADQGEDVFRRDDGQLPQRSGKIIGEDAGAKESH